jgi:type VI secretion system secreted protein Hcp
VASTDMFLKVQGVTGESADAQHKGEIEVVSWSWGMQSPGSARGDVAGGHASMTELEIVKHVDQSSPVLMQFLWQNNGIKQVRLAVRKSGGTSLEYLAIELKNARITSFRTESQNAEIIERVRFGFSSVLVTYIPQQSTGSRGAAVQFMADAHESV